MQKKQGIVEAQAPAVSSKVKMPSPGRSAVEEAAVPEPMDVEPPLASVPQPFIAAASAAESAAAPPSTPASDCGSQKKKKKTSYKNMMSSMMKQHSQERDVEKEKEALRKVTGGGAFSKIDKI
jgi:hypothetical protein